MINTDSSYQTPDGLCQVMGRGHPLGGHMSRVGDKKQHDWSNMGLIRFRRMSDYWHHAAVLARCKCGTDVFLWKKDVCGRRFLFTTEAVMRLNKGINGKHRKHNSNLNLNVWSQLLSWMCSWRTTVCSLCESSNRHRMAHRDDTVSVTSPVTYVWHYILLLLMNRGFEPVLIHVPWGYSLKGCYSLLQLLSLLLNPSFYRKTEYAQLEVYERSKSNWEVGLVKTSLIVWTTKTKPKL